MKIRETIRKRIVKKIRRIASKHGTTYAEANEVFRSQFRFAKMKIEELDEAWLATATKKELEELVFNFLYLGKIHSSEGLQKFAINKHNKLKDGDNKDTKD